MTVAAAMAALVFMPQRFLYSMAVRWRLGRGALLGDRDPRRPLFAGAGNRIDPLDPARAGGVRHLRRLNTGWRVG